MRGIPEENINIRRWRRKVKGYCVQQNGRNKTKFAKQTAKCAPFIHKIDQNPFSFLRLKRIREISMARVLRVIIHYRSSIKRWKIVFRKESIETNVSTATNKLKHLGLCLHNNTECDNSNRLKNEFRHIARVSFHTTAQIVLLNCAEYTNQEHENWSDVKLVLLAASQSIIWQFRLNWRVHWLSSVSTMTSQK